MQQTIATASALLEEVDLAQLVEESLRMSRGALNRHGVEVVRELEALPRLRLDKRKVLQILVNLISNAKQACRDSERSDKRIRLRLARAGGQIRVSVSDNGIGIPAENLTRIFQHGFTTREGGHGFGLHSAALAAELLGGALRVESDGPGQGATFTLELSLDSSTESTPQASSASLGMVARSSIRTD